MNGTIDVMKANPVFMNIYENKKVECYSNKFALCFACFVLSCSAMIWVYFTDVI